MEGVISIFGVRVPVSELEPKPENPRFRAPTAGNVGGRGKGAALIWEHVEYPSWEAASKATGLGKPALRWKLERR